MAPQSCEPACYYAATSNPFARLPALAGDTSCDLCIVGGGLTGLGAAIEAAERGLSVALLEATEVGAAASGRNGGLIHTGMRQDQGWLEQALGEPAARALWDIAEAARVHLYGLIEREKIPCDLKRGVLFPRHRERGAADDARRAAYLAKHYRYNGYRTVSREEMASLLGTNVYYGGLFDSGGGHLHPLNLAQGLAIAAIGRDARIFERTPALSFAREGARLAIKTPHGKITANWLILTGECGPEELVGGIASRVMPINSFLLATEPLGVQGEAIIKNDAAVTDSRHVVNYFRKSVDGRLIFGGGENYGGFPSDIAGFVRRHMLKIYPQLESARIDYAWGGTLSITMSRLPFVRRPAPNVLVSSGYSGQGVMLAPYFGKLLAEAAAGAIAGPIDTLARLPCPPFPGGSALRFPLLVAGLSYYALRDRLP